MGNTRKYGLRRGVQVAALTAFALTVAACSSTSSSTESPASQAEASTAAASEAPSEAAAAVTGPVGFAQANFGNGWYEVQAEGVKAEMAKLGLPLTVVSGEGKPQNQNSQVQTFITQGIKGLILNPTDPLAVESSLKALKDANIPVVLVNTSVDESLVPLTYCYVAEDEVANAREIGIVMANALREKYGSDATVKFVMIKGFPGDSNSTRRDKGFTEGYASVTDAPKLDRLEDVFGKFNANDVVAPLRSVATANPDLQAIFTVTDSMLPGIQAATEGAGIWDKLTIGGYDARMSVVKQMADDPNGPIVATVANRPFEQGAIGAGILNQAMQGVPQSEACPGGNHFIKPTVVTPATAADYYNADVPY